jgi:hypothetical protein
MYSNVEEYINIVLSQIDCLETKKVVYQVLCSDNNKHIINSTKEQLFKILLVKMGDPKTLGHYFLWLKNLVDLH